MSRRTTVATIAVLTILVSVVGASAGLAQTADPITMTVTGPTPNPTTPGSTSIIEVTYTPNADTVGVNPVVSLEGTGGNGTVSIVSATGELTNCTVNAANRGVMCAYDATVAAGPSVLTVQVNVGSGATAGQTWNIHAGAVENPPTSGVFDVNQWVYLDIVDPLEVAVSGPTPNPVDPGTDATIELTYAPNTSISNVDPSVELHSSHPGTLYVIGATNELTNCVLADADHDVNCDYDATAAAGPSVLTVGVTGTAAGPGETWAMVWAAWQGSAFLADTLNLDITDPVTTTTTSTTTSTTTTTTSTTTTTAPTVTSSTLPATGIDDVKGPTAAGFALVVLGIVLLSATYAFARRND